jgi:hypothetical protein
MITQEFEMIGDDLVDTARSDIIDRMETVLNHHQALLAGHFESGSRTGADGEINPQVALDQLRLVADELAVVFGHKDTENRQAEAAE